MTKTKTKSAAEIRAEIARLEEERQRLDAEERERQEAARREEQARYTERMQAILESAGDILSASKRRGKEASEDEKRAKEDGDLNAFLEARARWHAERAARRRIIYTLEDAETYLSRRGVNVPTRPRSAPRSVEFVASEVLAEFVSATKNLIPRMAENIAHDSVVDVLGDEFAEDI